jgi:hypothetical protein
VAGMVAGADSIDDMALLRHGGMGRVFARGVRPVDVGVVPAGVHVRARAPARRGRRAVLARAGRSARAAATTTGRRRLWRGSRSSTWTTPSSRSTATPNRGAGFGYTRVRGLNALIATLTHTRVCSVGRGATSCARVPCGSPRGAQRLVGDAVKQTRRLLGEHAPVLVRMDSAYYGRDAVHAAITGGAGSVGHRPSGPGCQGRDRFNP